MKKIGVLLLILLTGISSAYAQREYGLKFSSLLNEDLTLENAIRLGLENNTDFLAAREEITIAEQKVKEAKFMFLPQISVQATATWYDLDYPMVLPESVANRFIPNNELLRSAQPDAKHQFFGVGASATQYLYSGGRITNTLKMARANLKQAQSKHEAIKNNIILDIKHSFFTLLHAQEQIAFSNDVAKKAENYYASFKLSSWEQIKAYSILAQLQANRSQAENNLKRAEIAMLVSLNKELNSKIRMKGDFKPVKIDSDLPHLNLWAMEFRPELKSAIYALELDNIAIDLALSKRYPDLILMGSYEQLGFDNLEDVNKQISLAVRLPLPYSLATQFAQKKAEQRQSTLHRSAIEDRINIQVAESYENMKFWQTEVLSRGQAFTTITDLLSKAEKTAKPGVLCLEALSAYYLTGTSYLESVNKNLLSKARLEWAVGQDF